MPGYAIHARLRSLAAGLLLCGLAATSVAEDLPELPRLNLVAGESSVSGISSGGFMAAQFGVAHASLIKGVGIVAAGPYYCAQGSVLKATTQCSCTLDPSRSLCDVPSDDSRVPALLEATRRFASKGWIDDPAAIARQRIWSFAGGKDQTVPAPVVAQLGAYYSALGVPAAQQSAVLRSDAGHSMPTSDFGKPCPVSEEPYINDCDFDSAKAILSWIYGPLKAARKGKLGGRLLAFNQNPYIPQNTSYLWGSGLDRSGWLFVPAACAAGEACRLHIVFHGCRQGQSYLPLRAPAGGGLYYGTQFVEHAGYNRWADTNRIVVLYPQAVSIPFKNPNACWDWWGYTNTHYADQQGVQIATIKAMIDALFTQP